jgi:hypothetical protein
MPKILRGYKLITFIGFDRLSQQKFYLLKRKFPALAGNFQSFGDKS